MPSSPTPATRFQDINNNLVRISGAVRGAGGEVVILKSRVLDAERRSVSGARVEIWQCDVNGIYLHTRNRTAEYDDAFQGFGHFTTGEDGAYAFRTIRPAVYPGRTPHIHVKVLVGAQELTAQFYLPDHHLNDRDWLYQRMSATEREAVTMRFDKSAEPEAVVDILL